MRILVVASELPGSCEAFVVGHVPAMRRAGHAVDVVTVAHGAAGLYDLDGPDGHPPVLGRPRPLAATRLLRDPRTAADFAERSARRGRARAATTILGYAPYVAQTVGVVHHTSPASAVAAPGLGALLRVPTVVTVDHGNLDALDVAVPRRAKRVVTTLQGADALSVATVSERDRLRSVVPDADIRLVAPGALPSGPRPPTADRTDDCPDGRVPAVVVAGVLDYRLGLEYVLAAMERLVAGGVEFVADVAGDGDLRRYLQFTVDQLGLAEHVRWRGSMSPRSLGHLVRNGDVYVTSGAAELVTPAARTAVEAGLAIVTTTLGGTSSSLVEPGRSGEVVPGRDVGAMAACLATLLRDRSRRERLGLHAREAAAGTPSASAPVLAYDDLASTGDR